MNIVGYCTIARGASTGLGANLDKFIGKDCRVMEFSEDGGVLVLSPEGDELAMFDKADVKRKFRCIESNGIVMPPGLDAIEQMVYQNKVISRKGGYSVLLKHMVVQAGLMKGSFSDGFLFQNQ